MGEDNKPIIVSQGSERPEIITWGGPGLLPIKLTRRDTNMVVTVNWSKFVTLDGIYDWTEERGSEEAVPIFSGSRIVFEGGLEMEVVETPEQIDEIVRESLTPQIFIKDII